jgi:leucyl aminopeptidase (aminopeptidase T)
MFCAVTIPRHRPRAIDPAFAIAARSILEGSLSLVPGDRVLIIVDANYEELAGALEDAALSLRAVPTICRLTGARPFPRLPPEFATALSNVQASVMAISERADEATVRREVIDLIGRHRVRHAHLVGISRAALGQGFLADARRVQDSTRKLRLRIGPTSQIVARSNAGTKLEIKLDPTLRWGASVGRIGPGQWENLPSGQLFTCPADVRGVYVADASVTADEGRAFDVVRAPLTLEIDAGICRRVRCIDPRMAGEFERRLRAAEHLTQVGQILLGTNAGLSAPIGDAIFDCNVPGLHLTFGYTAPADTGARWCSRLGVTANAARMDVDIDGTAVVRQGRLVI